MKTTERIKKARIVRGDDFDHNMLLFKGKPKFLEFLTSRKFTVKKSKQSYRVINHWTKLGLIDDYRSEKNSGWRKFSITDIVWLSIIMSMRRFGFPNEKILKVKDSLIDLEYPKGGYYPIFECYVSMALVMKRPVSIIVFEDGFTEIAQKTEIDNSEMIGILGEDHLKISVNDALQGIFTKEDLKPILTLPYSKEESEIIELIRSGKYESVKVKFKNGKIQIFEATEEVEERIINILKEHKYQNIELKQQAGRVVSIKRTFRKKFKATE